MAQLFKRPGRAPWYFRYYTADGRRPTKCARTTDRRAAERIAREHEAREALLREGVLDTRAVKLAEEGRRPLREHVEAFLADLEARGRSSKHVAKTAQHLHEYLEETGAQRLADLSAERLTASMASLRARGLSARIANARRQALGSFGNWCARSGRLDANPLRYAKSHDEGRDRRRERRELTVEEVEALLRVTEGERRAWYSCAVYAALRRSEIERLAWGDVNFEERILRIRDGKARALDEIPLHPALAAELRGIQPALLLPRSRVFAHSPTNDERRADFERAGIALVDAAGLHADVHALRGTCATLLLRAGVAVPVVQKILRHADPSTTLKHYSRLGIADAARALGALPSFHPSAEERAEVLRASGTEGAAIGSPLVAHGGTASCVLGATPRENDAARDRVEQDAKSCARATIDNAVRVDATTREEMPPLGLEPRTRGLRILKPDFRAVSPGVACCLERPVFAGTYGGLVAASLWTSRDSRARILTCDGCHNGCHDGHGQRQTWTVRRQATLDRASRGEARRSNPGFG